MKSEQRIFRTFIIFGLIAGILLASVYGVLAYSRYRQNTEDTVRRAASAAAVQVENRISQAQTVSMVLLSDQDALTAIHSLAAKEDTPRGATASLYLSEDYAAIRGPINSYFTLERFYRVIWFNELGDVVAGNNIAEKVLDTAADWTSVPGLSALAPGQLSLLAVHADEWGRSHETQVVSAVKRLVGTNMGFIEVQWTAADLTALLEPADESYSVTLLDESGTLLFGPDETDAALLQRAELTSEQAPEQAEGMRQDGDRITLLSWNETARCYILLVYPINLWHDILRRIVPWLVLILALFLVLSRLYARRSAARLVRPIEALAHVMQQTDLENMTRAGEEVREELQSTEETALLYSSYRSVMGRLAESMEREQRFSVLQLQAQMDLLQAQVNPHFIYNVLNVISAKGIMSGDESICDICSRLGRMLRYSTNTREKMGTIAEEVSYLELYFSLLKYRYEHRLEYEIAIDPAIEAVQLPKIVLQQLVENSINHGYEDRTRTMHLRVSGSGTPENWRVTVSDNGSGFSDGKQAEVEAKIEAMRRRLEERREHIEMEIGGLGLINTYARLYLMFDGRLAFTIRSGENGTDVTIAVSEDGNGAKAGTEAVSRGREGATAGTVPADGNAAADAGKGEAGERI